MSVDNKLLAYGSNIIGAVGSQTTAQQVTYDHTTSGLSAVTAQSAIDELNGGKVNKSGDTMSGDLVVNHENGTISTDGYSRLYLGNNIPVGTDKNSSGLLGLYTKSGNVVEIYDVNNNITAYRSIALPDASGTLALEPTDESGDLLSYVQSGFNASAGQVTYYKRGKIVTIRCNGAYASAVGDGQHLLASLPSKFSPAIQTFVVATDARGSVLGLGFVSGSSVSINVAQAMTGMYFTLTYQSLN